MLRALEKKKEISNVNNSNVISQSDLSVRCAPDNISDKVPKAIAVNDDSALKKGLIYGASINIRPNFDCHPYGSLILSQSPAP